jgi:hypothetical protein
MWLDVPPDDVTRERRLFFTNLDAMCEFMVDQRRLALSDTAREEWAG